MAIDRLRRGLLVAGGAAAIGAVAWWRSEADGGLLLAACDDAQGRHFIAALDQHGELCFRIPVQYRAHAIAVLPDRQRAVFFARRPGTVSYVVDLAEGALLTTLISPPGRHFYGHGAVAADGLLYTSENDYAKARGMVGVWDPGNGLQRVGEFASGGTGPHELAFLRDGQTLVVANGGIATHPDQPRKKLNIPVMQPSLTYLDTRTARVIDSFRPADHLMSLRHLAVTPSDQVIVGVQYEGEQEVIVPLLFSHRGAAQLEAATASAPVWRSHRNYIASVAASADGRQAIITAPRGATASLWNLSTLTLQSQRHIRDVAGVTADRDGFVLSSGGGQMLRTSAAPDMALSGVAAGASRWDNHLAVA